MENRLIKMKSILICSLIAMSLLSCINEDDENVINTVSVEETFKTIKAGESFEIVLTEDSSKQDLTYKSYNLEVATVDENGVVTGIGTGFAIITIENAQGAEATIELTVEKADFYVPIDIVGQWTGVKIELIGKPGGDVYDEETIKGMLNNELTDEEKEAWLDVVRKQFSYQMNDDNSIRMYIPLEDGGRLDIIGELTGDDKYKNIYHAMFDVESTNIPELAEYKKQQIVFDGEFISIETYFGPDFNLVTYYQIEK